MAKSQPHASSRSGLGFTIAGLVLVVLAALLALLIAPKLTQLPGGFTSTVNYDGSSAQLDSATLKLGEPEDASAVRETAVESTDGSTAVISSTTTATLPTGKNVTEKTFAIDRTTYQQVEADDVDDQQDGMVLSHVRHPNKDDFATYDATTDTAQRVSYVETTTIEGREAYLFKGTTIAPVVSEGTLKTLQESVGESMGTDGTVLPSATVANFVAQLPGDDGQKLRDALAAAGPEVDATYVSTNTTSVWIDTELGSPLKMAQDQTISLYATLGDTPHPILDLSRLQLESDADSVKELVDTASSNATKIALVQVYVPIALAVLGLLLIVAGFLRGRSGRPSAPNTDTKGPAERELAGAGRS